MLRDEERQARIIVHVYLFVYLIALLHVKIPSWLLVDYLLAVQLFLIVSVVLLVSLSICSVCVHLSIYLYNATLSRRLRHPFSLSHSIHITSILLGGQSLQDSFLLLLCTLIPFPSPSTYRSMHSLTPSMVSSLPSNSQDEKT